MCAKGTIIRPAGAPQRGNVYGRISRNHDSCLRCVARASIGWCSWPQALPEPLDIGQWSASRASAVQQDISGAPLPPSHLAAALDQPPPRAVFRICGEGPSRTPRGSQLACHQETSPGRRQHFRGPQTRSSRCQLSTSSPVVSCRQYDLAGIDCMQHNSYQTEQTGSALKYGCINSIPPSFGAVRRRQLCWRDIVPHARWLQDTQSGNWS